MQKKHWKRICGNYSYPNTREKSFPKIMAMTSRLAVWCDARGVELSWNLETWMNTWSEAAARLREMEKKQ